MKYTVETTDTEIIYEQCTPSKWCSALDSFLTEYCLPERAAYGIECVTKTPINGGGENREAIAYRLPKRAFIWLNFCPFCGGATDSDAFGKVTLQDGRVLHKKYAPFLGKDA